MAREYDVKALLGSDFEFELSPEVLAYELSLDFSNQIIMRCADIGLTLGELAMKMGIKPSTLSEKLSGQNMTLKSIASMAIALNCDVKAPELIVETDVAFKGSRPWSVSDAVSAANEAPQYAGSWPVVESVLETTVAVSSSKRSSTSYRSKAVKKEAA